MARLIVFLIALTLSVSAFSGDDEPRGIIVSPSEKYFALDERGLNNFMRVVRHRQVPWQALRLHKIKQECWVILNKPAMELAANINADVKSRVTFARQNGDNSLGLGVYIVKRRPRTPPYRDIWDLVVQVLTRRCDLLSVRLVCKTACRAVTARMEELRDASGEIVWDAVNVGAVEMKGFDSKILQDRVIKWIGLQSYEALKRLLETFNEAPEENRVFLLAFPDALRNFKCFERAWDVVRLTKTVKLAVSWECLPHAKNPFEGLEDLSRLIASGVVINSFTACFKGKSDFGNVLSFLQTCRPTFLGLYTDLKTHPISDEEFRSLEKWLQLGHVQSLTIGESFISNENLFKLVALIGEGKVILKVLALDFTTPSSAKLIKKLQMALEDERCNLGILRIEGLTDALETRQLLHPFVNSAVNALLSASVRTRIEIANRNNNVRFRLYNVPPPAPQLEAIGPALPNDNNAPVERHLEEVPPLNDFDCAMLDQILKEVERQNGAIDVAWFRSFPNHILSVLLNWGVYELAKHRK